jgi:hypothetical protein
MLLTWHVCQLHGEDDDGNPCEFVQVLAHVNEDTLRRAEKFANLGLGEYQAQDIDEDSIRNVLHCHGFSNDKENVHLYRLLRPRLRQKLFWNGTNPERKYFSEEKVRVVVHLRRGDALRHPHRVMPLDEYQRMLRKVVAAFNLINKPYRIIVHSEGDPDELLVLQEEFGAELRMDVDLLDVWLEFVNADVLMLSKSSFSYSAGLYSDGIVVYKPSLLTGTLMDWYSTEESDFVDQLKEALLRKIAYSNSVDEGVPYPI